MTTEQLQWHPASGSKPDAYSVVLLWLTPDPKRGMHAPAGWEAGFWDGEVWRLAESGGKAAGTVTHWAMPEGPVA